MTLFHVGEKVVYPNQGIATVENISSRTFGARFEKFYFLRLTYAEMTMIVPFSHVEDIGLRKVTGNRDLCRILALLSERQSAAQTGWKDRFKVNSEKMRSGSLLGIAEVLKSLLLLQNEKPLSFREKRMLQRARHLLITELSISRGLPEGKAIELLQKALGEASLALPPTA